MRIVWGTWISVRRIPERCWRSIKKLERKRKCWMAYGSRSTSYDWLISYHIEGLGDAAGRAVQRLKCEDEFGDYGANCSSLGITVDEERRCFCATEARQIERFGDCRLVISGCPRLEERSTSPLNATSWQRRAVCSFGELPAVRGYQLKVLIHSLTWESLQDLILEALIRGTSTGPSAGIEDYRFRTTRRRKDRRWCRCEVQSSKVQDWCKSEIKSDWDQ